MWCVVVRESTGESSSLVVAFFTRLLCSTSMPVVALELDYNATKVSRKTCVTGSGVALLKESQRILTHG